MMANLGDQEKKLIDGGVGRCCDLLGQIYHVLLHGMPDLQWNRIGFRETKHSLNPESARA
jgi:hypothetical protein